MLNFNDSLTTTSAILIEAMNTRAVDRQLGVTRIHPAGRRRRSDQPDLLGLNGPFLYIVGQSTSPAEAKRVVLEAQKLMREKLRWLAALAERPGEDLRRPRRASCPPRAPQPDRARGVKSALLAFVFGFLLSMGIAYFRDKSRTRASRSHCRCAGPAADLAPPSDSRPAPGADRPADVDARSETCSRTRTTEEGFDGLRRSSQPRSPASRATSPEPTNGSEVAETRKARAGAATRAREAEGQVQEPVTLRSRQVDSSPDTGTDEGFRSPAPKARRPRLRRRVALVALVLVVAFAATTARLFVWPSLPPLPAHADAIIELAGPGDRDAVTIALAQKHLAPVVIQSTLARRRHLATPACRRSPTSRSSASIRRPADDEGRGPLHRGAGRRGALELGRSS